jgi:hypothetical protein
MSQERYIGIENELTSFKDDAFDSEIIRQGFELGDFNKLLKDEYFKISDTSIRSNHGNGYYIDGDEIEIITPPIALNKGFSTRLTNALVIGREHVIKNTPHMQHTGYSMHWNLSHADSNFNLEYKRNDLINNLCIPFQLFGLTPLSCGFDVRTYRRNDRYEIIGDSLTDVNQINATALLLGSYCALIESTCFYRGNFPITLSKLDYNKYIPNMLDKGRYSKINVELDNKDTITQAQNILEIFYDWLSPFVYKLSERDEINNLEAFIKGTKKLERDDIKYFKKIKQNECITDSGVYLPLSVDIRRELKSQLLYSNNYKSTVPIEGELLGIYASHAKVDSYNNFITKSMNWDEITISKIEYDTVMTQNHSTYTEMKQCNKLIKGVDAIYTFAEQYCNKEYAKSLDTKDIFPRKISEKKMNLKLRKKAKY